MDKVRAVRAAVEAYDGASPAVGPDEAMRVAIKAYAKTLFKDKVPLDIKTRYGAMALDAEYLHDIIGDTLEAFQELVDASGWDDGAGDCIPAPEGVKAFAKRMLFVATTPKAAHQSDMPSVVPEPASIKDELKGVRGILKDIAEPIPTLAEKIGDVKGMLGSIAESRKLVTGKLLELHDEAAEAAANPGTPPEPPIRSACKVCGGQGVIRGAEIWEPSQTCPSCHGLGYFTTATL